MADRDTMPALHRGLALRRQIAVVRSGLPDLTTRQKAILMIVAWEPGPHRVRHLAEKLDVSKPVITRALNTLGPAGLGFLRRRRDDADLRDCFVEATAEGQGFLDRLEDVERG
jgi:DNA-binding MarR family transcriptional regulator